MARKCSTCQHIRRAEIDRRLAAGEPGNQIAEDYGLNPSSLHRHRSNCLRLGSSNAIMKEVSRGTAAITCLPSKDDLNTAYFQLRAQIDQIVSQARAEGSLQVALSVNRRNKIHLAFVAAQPCLVCRRSPCDAHHLKFAQPRSLGRKVSDEFTVPLCRDHHLDLHRRGNETAWWANLQIVPTEAAKDLWQTTLLDSDQ